jgi:serine/threonine protein kinase
MVYWQQLQSLPPGPLRSAQQRVLLRRLGETVGHMHRLGISHGDLRCGNIHVTRCSGELQFVFLDNERTVRYRRLPARLRLKNLVQLNMHRADVISSTDRWRFWRAYLQQNPDLQDQARVWGRRVARKTAWRLQRRFAKRPETITSVPPTTICL